MDAKDKPILFENEPPEQSGAIQPQRNESELSGGGVPAKPETAQGWTTTETSSPEDDMRLTVEKQEEQKRLEALKARQNFATSVIDKIIPLRTLEQHQKSTIRMLAHLEGKIDMNARAESSFLGESRNRNELAYSIARTSIVENDLEKYISSIYSMATELSPTGEGINPYFFRSLVGAAETVEQGVLFQEFAKKWKDRFLTNVDDTTVASRANDFEHIVAEFSGTKWYPRPAPRSEVEMRQLFDAFADVYGVAYFLPNDEQNQKVFRTLISGAERIGLDSHDAEQTRKILKVYKEAANREDLDIVERFVDVVARYGWHHGLTEAAVHGLTEKLLPAMERKDRQVEILLSAGNVWGMEKGDFGVADFEVACYALEVTPLSINALLMASREVPTTNLARLEQNRLDGLTLSSPFGALRDFIHDQRPYVHEVIKAMVDYYDAGDKEHLLSVLANADPGYLGASERQAAILDKSRYDSEISERRKDGNPQDETVKLIDVLRRLEENTRPIPDAPPVTSDAEFNNILEQIAQAKETQGYIGKEAIGDVLKYANEKLLAMMKQNEIGIEQNHVLALGWLEQRAFDVLQRLNYEDQQGAYKKEWFREILKFQELTASQQTFNEQEFNKFIQKVSSSDFKTAYRLISERTLENISGLTGKYKDEGRENRIDALWSGNVAHELIGLVDLRPASTAYGKRHREEQSLPEHKRTWGD